MSLERLDSQNLENVESLIRQELAIPDVAEKVRTGEMTGQRAWKLMSKDQRKAAEVWVFQKRVFDGLTHAAILTLWKQTFPLIPTPSSGKISSMLAKQAEEEYQNHETDVRSGITKIKRNFEIRHNKLGQVEILLLEHLKEALEADKEWKESVRRQREIEAASEDTDEEEDNDGKRRGRRRQIDRPLHNKDLAEDVRETIKLLQDNGKEKRAENEHYSKQLGLGAAEKVAMEIRHGLTEDAQNALEQQNETRRQVLEAIQASKAADELPDLPSLLALPGGSREEDTVDAELDE